MLKKKLSQKIPCVRKQPKPSIQCSICNCFSTTTAFYVCDSGHIMCANCRKSNESEGRQEGGDYVLENAYKQHAELLKKNEPLSTIKDLSSGDHGKNNRANKERKVKSECKIDMSQNQVDTKSTILEKINEEKPELETIIEYKNVNYREDKSSTCSQIGTGSKHDVEYIIELPQLPQLPHLPQLPQLPDSRVCPRWYHYLILEFSGPVKCPVEECNKMIALDSVMLHFYFDHSKVPQMTLNGSTVRQLQLKPSNLYSESHCLTIFLLQEKNEVNLCTKVDSGALINGNYTECKSLLLMAAKIQTEKYKNLDTTKVAVHNVHTQTVMLQNVVKKRSNVFMTIKQSMPYESVAQKQFEDNETLLLWLCKQDDNTASYSISILRKDKKQGHSYIGEAIHIRNEQSPALMLQRAQCLIVCGAALNRLLDEDNQINVYIEVLA